MKSIRYISIATCLLVFSVNIINAQTAQQEKRKFIAFAGLVLQKNLFLNAAVFWTKMEEVPHQGFFLKGPFAGGEISLTGPHFIIAPRIGYQYILSPLIVKAGITNYFTQNGSDLRLTPELGVNVLAISLTYGYSIRLLQHKATEIGPHRIALSVFLKRKLWKD